MKSVCLSILTISCLHLQAEPVLSARCKQVDKQPALFEQGDQKLPPNVGAAYNYPACMKLQHGWDTFATASYIYWFAGEDGLDLATTATFVTEVSGMLTIPDSTIVFQNTGYHSGFKLGLGYTFLEDGWVLRADYTRYHMTNHLSKTAGGEPGTVFELTNWFYQVSSRQQTPGAVHLKSSWNLRLDWLDVALQKPFYVGKQFTVNPFLGLRASWISQAVDITLNEVLNFNPPTSSVHSNNRSHNWSLGPRIGADASFLLGAGVKFKGSIAESLLYTDFTTIAHSEDPLFFGAVPVTFKSDSQRVFTPITELLLGLGWGSYFSDQRYHLDLSATYDFYFLQDQNQIRVVNDIEIDGINGGAKPLFIHGLTATATFGF